MIFNQNTKEKTLMTIRPRIQTDSLHRVSETDERHTSDTRANSHGPCGRRTGGEPRHTTRHPAHDPAPRHLPPTCPLPTSGTRHIPHPAHQHAASIRGKGRHADWRTRGWKTDETGEGEAPRGGGTHARPAAPTATRGTARRDARAARQSTRPGRRAHVWRAPRRAPPLLRAETEAALGRRGCGCRTVAWLPRGSLLVRRLHVRPPPRGALPSRLRLDLAG